MRPPRKQEIQVINIPDKQIIDSTPSWFPIDEWGFKSYLVRNPHLIAQGIHFVGFELYYADLVFENDESLYLVEAKHIPNKKVADAKIYSGQEQLEKYCNKFNDRMSVFNDSQELIPILALMTSNNSIKNAYPLMIRRLKSLRKRIEQAQTTLHQYQSKLRDVKNQFLEYSHLVETDNLPKATQKLREEYQELIHEVAELHRKKDSLKFGIYLQSEIQAHEHVLNSKLY